VRAAGHGASGRGSYWATGVVMAGRRMWARGAKAGGASGGAACCGGTVMFNPD